ncbi:hypothetical protein KPSA1_07208 [Pseudomonas syringae pv. actinidiae]|uniref:Uncharacterized protein n=1 Tax=Pseudomonas syringae pv. actinidiae TaxID=103796 RepID=A0A2V0QTZ4_PSESF|nr:hypothetical protein KPSA1_07208 [Pseudomonas syringae pv. actinidiae]
MAPMQCILCSIVVILGFQGSFMTGTEVQFSRIPLSGTGK